MGCLTLLLTTSCVSVYTIMLLCLLFVGLNIAQILVFSYSWQFALMHAFIHSLSGQA